MRGDDRAQAEALDHVWDRLVGRPGEPVRARELDPDIQRVPARLAALERAAAGRPDSVPDWSSVRDRIQGSRATASARPARGRARVAAQERRAWRAATRDGGRVGSRPAPRWWPPLELAIGVGVIVALVGFVFGWDLDGFRDDPPRTGSFGGAPETMLPAPSRTPVLAAGCGEMVALGDRVEPEGPELWEYEGQSVTGAFFHRSGVPVVAGDLVLVGGSASQGEGAAAVMALDAATGGERWWQWIDPPGETFGGVRVISMVASPFAIVVATDGGWVAALDPATGDPRWHRHVGSGTGMVALAIDASGTAVYAADAGNDPAGFPRQIGIDAGGETVVVTANTPATRMVAISVADGAEIWAVPIDTEEWAASGHEPSVMAFDPGSGGLRWRHGVDAPLTMPAIGGDAVFVSGADGTTRALALVDGFERWRSPAPGDFVTDGDLYVPPQALAVTADTLYVLGKSVMAALDPDDGSSRWCARVDGGVRVDAGDTFVAVGARDGVYGFDSATGASGWFIRGWPQSLPALATYYPVTDGDRLFIGDWDGRVVAHNRAEGTEATQ